jgi:hypothetical protein
MPSIRGLSRDDSDSHHLNSTFSGRWGCGKRPENSARGGSRTRNDRSGKTSEARLRSERWRRAQDSAKTPGGKAMARGRHLERRFGVSQRIAQVRIWKTALEPEVTKMAVTDHYMARAFCLVYSAVCCSRAPHRYASWEARQTANWQWFNIVPIDKGDTVTHTSAITSDDSRNWGGLYRVYLYLDQQKEIQRQQSNGNYNLDKSDAKCSMAVIGDFHDRQPSRSPLHR